MDFKLKNFTMKEKYQMGFVILLFEIVFKIALFGVCSFALTEDGIILLEFRSDLNDTKNALSNWNDTDESPCQWTGIFCSPEDQRVVSINLPYMHLGGIISPSIGKLARLQRLALHQNSLHGYIPREIANCTELRALYLRGNYLQGSIPSEIGTLSYLTILDLSSNLLKGTIPSSLAHLARLRHLNLSSNFLSGEIPDIDALSGFGNGSFIGNLDLCGRQLHKLCRSSLGFPAVLPRSESEVAVPNNQQSHYIKGFVIGAMSMLGVAVIVILAFLWVCSLSKKEKTAKRYTEVNKQVEPEAGAKLITFHGDLPYPSVEIMEKLESLGEEDVVGSGGSGTVYRMVMNDCGTFAVKRIDQSRKGSEQAFERELEILGSIKHVNLVNLRGYCRLASSKLLIYDYLTMGSLYDILHERIGESLSWRARLKIAFGSARGLAYLHHDCYPRIIHRDIKSSNILLDENLEPHVADFGLAKLLEDDEAHITTVVAGTFGYLAPEYLQSGRATEKSDVYSFGVLLLELVTGKRPTDPCFVNKGLNVVGWTNMVLKENKFADVIDKTCRDVDPETAEAMVGIAARCTDPNPDHRPWMNEVLLLIEREVLSPIPSDFYESHSDYC